VSKRPVIVHYHLFKNAGTSVDKILQQNFPETWAEVEGEGNRRITSEALLDYIRQHPHLDAVSSHTAVVSVPKVDDIEILPILFVRHPLDRIRSAYLFERQQDVQTPGAIHAKIGGFKDYLEWRLSTQNPWQIKNFHIHRLKDFYKQTPPQKTDECEAQAFKAIEDLPMVGLVEKFDQSMAVFRDIIGVKFPEFNIFSAHENLTSNPTTSLKDNLAQFSDMIGVDVYKHLHALNENDFRLYARLKSRFN